MPDFSPWYCSTCQTMVPVSSLTHWIDMPTTIQHAVKPPGSGAVSRPEHTLGTRVPTPAPQVIVQRGLGSGADLWAVNENGDVLSTVSIYKALHVDGRELPELVDRVRASIELAYYDQIEA